MVSAKQGEARPIVTLGEALVDLVAEGEATGSLASARSFVRAAGGAPANVAVGVARLAHPSAFIGKLSADPFGDHLLETLRSAGVRLSPAARTDAPTALAFVALSEGGERDFTFYRRGCADLELAPAEIDEELLAGAAALHVGSLSLTGEPARSATLYALSVAEAAGAVRSVDPNLRLDLWPTEAAAREAAFALIERATLLKLSAEELAFLTGSASSAAAAELLTGGLELVVITDGAKGSRYVVQGASGSVPSPKVTPVDTTGAGDAFMAALLVELTGARGLRLERAALRSALRRANAYAALTVTRRGAIPALPTRKEFEAFLSGLGD